MKKSYQLSLVCLFLLLLSSCGSELSKEKQSLEESTKQSTHTSTNQSTSKEEVATESKSLDSTVTSIECPFEPPVELETIYYQDLNVSEPIQANAQYLGCYIVDDGKTVNLIPLMAATVQNLHLYTSGEGNQEYYQQFLDKAMETSNLTNGKPVSIFDREDGSVIITAESGKIVFSL